MSIRKILRKHKGKMQCYNTFYEKDHYGFITFKTFQRTVQEKEQLAHPVSVHPQEQHVDFQDFLNNSQF